MKKKHLDKSQNWSSKIKLRAIWKICSLLPDPTKVLTQKPKGFKFNGIFSYFDKKRRVMNYFPITTNYINKKNKLLKKLQENNTDYTGDALIKNPSLVEKIVDLIKNKSLVEKIVDLIKNKFLARDIANNETDYTGDVLIKIYETVIKTCTAGNKCKIDDDLNDYIQAFIKEYNGTKDAAEQLEIWAKFNMNLWADRRWYEAGLLFDLLKDKKKSLEEQGVGQNIEALMHERAQPNDPGKITIYYNEGNPIEINEKSLTDKFLKEAPRKELIPLYLPWYYAIGIDIDKTALVLGSVFLLPIFDIYIGNKGYGGFNGFYNFQYKELKKKQRKETFWEWFYRHLGYKEPKKKQRKETIKNIIKETKPHLAVLSKEIYLSNLFRIENKKIKKKPSYNFVDYFLQMIIYVQDWENIWVTTKSIEQSEKNEKNKFTEEDINRYWTRKSPDEKKGKFTYEWIDSSNGDKGVNELKPVVTGKNFFKFHIEEEVAFLLKKEDTEYDKKILDEYLICKYPEASVIPNDASDLKKYEENLTQRFLRVFGIAISAWKKDKYKITINVAKGCVEQMSHNLHYVPAGIRKELKLLKSEDDMQANIIEGSDNFLEYIVNRFSAFSCFYEDIPGGYMPKSIDESIEDFKKQKLFLKHITKATKNCGNEVEIIDHNKEYGKLRLLYQPLYMFLEHYIRYVAEHLAVSSDTISCHVKISRIENSEYRMCIWEDSKKELGVEEFYKAWKDLNDNHQKVQEARPFSLRDKQEISAMEWYLKSLVDSKDTWLEVSPVVVLGSGKQCISYKIEEIKVEKDKCEYYYTDKAEGKIRLCHSNNQRFSMKYSFNIQNQS